MAAKEVLQQGFHGRWIPIPNSFMVASPRPHIFEGEPVETLLDRESCGWDISAVKRVFSYLMKWRLS